MLRLCANILSPRSVNRFSRSFATVRRSIPAPSAIRTIRTISLRPIRSRSFANLVKKPAAHKLGPKIIKYDPTKKVSEQMSNCEKSGDTLEGIFIGTVEFKVEFTGTSDGLRKYFIDSIVRNNENETIERFHHTKNSESIDDFFLNQQPKRNRGGRR